MYRYRYPLDTERFSARPLERVRVVADLSTSQPLAAVYSPTHALDITRSEARRATVAYEEHNVRPALDFILYYAVTPAEVGVSLLTYRAPGDDTFFLLIVSPPDLGEISTIPKDIVLVLDRSGSMNGEKIDQAKTALCYIVENLNPNDRFAVLSFSDIASALYPTLIPVTSTAVAETTAWISDLKASGGTNIDLVLTQALALFDDAERPRFLVFLTDGEPTVGETDPARIATHALVANTTGTRLFAFGVGYDVNTVLLDQLALENHGTTSYVAPGEDLGLALSTFYRKIASPVLSDVSVAIDGIVTYDVFPRALPDLFSGTQLLLLGRATGIGAANVTVSGQTTLGFKSYTSSVSFSASMTEPTLPRLWAGRKIAYTLDQIRLYGESDELVNEVIALSRQYGIITPYTSFLVEEDNLSAEAARDMVYRAAAPASGAGAVQASSSLKSLAEDAAGPTTTEAVRIVGDRAYFLRNSVWTDSLYASQETLDIAAYSAAYFALIDVVPWIGPHLAVGDRLIVRVGTVYVRIAEEGTATMTESMISLLTE
jgi:Ca-activated chloride channel family protein